MRPTSDCVTRLYLLGLTLCPLRFVCWDDEKLRETQCQSGLFTLIGRESANKEAHLPETMILEIPPPPPPADVSGLGRRRYGGRGPEPASPGKVGARWWEDWVGSGGLELGLSCPASPRITSGAGDAGREGAGREGGGGERKKG